MATLHAAATESLTSLADRRYTLPVTGQLFAHTLALLTLETSMSSSSSHLQDLVVNLDMLFAAWPPPLLALLAVMAC